jgi:hypothetical protein
VLQTQLAAWKESNVGKQEKDENPNTPRKTDPGAFTHGHTFYIYVRFVNSYYIFLILIVELKRRQERDLELARQRKEKFTMQAAKKTERNRRVSDLMQHTAEPAVERDPNRLLVPTKASQAAKVYGEDLDAAEHRRATIGAHGQAIAMSGRDLAFSGRSKPAWMRPPG